MRKFTRLAFLATLVSTAIIMWRLLTSNLKSAGPRRVRRLAESLQRHRSGDAFSTARALEIPWMTRELLAPSSKAGKGIVIPVGEKYTALALHAVKVLLLLDCQLPIEIAFFGDADLSAGSQARFTEYPNVRLLDLASRLQGHLALTGWDIKPFAILFSSFERVLLMDADVVWLQNPALILDSAAFARTGALFFIDRVLRKSRFDYATWLATLLPSPPSATVRAGQLFRGASDHQQESGVVLIDTSRRLYGLLATCLLNTPPYRQEIRGKTYGEKESYWLGFEIAKEPYEFYDGEVGTIGQALKSRTKEDFLICGHLLHFTPDSQPLWFNDGIVVNKHTGDLRVANFTHFSRGGTWQDICLLSSSVQQISSPLRNRMDDIISLWVPH